MKTFEVINEKELTPKIHIKGLFGKLVEYDKNFTKEFMESVIILNCTLDFAEELVKAIKIAMIMGFDSEKEKCTIILNLGYGWENTDEGLMIYKLETGKVLKEII